jgi:tetratricopeptide repeat protein 21B
LESHPNFAAAQVLLGWLDLPNKKSDMTEPPGEQELDKVLITAHKKDIEALLCKAKYFEVGKEFVQALEILNQVIVSFSWFSPALTEKAKVLLVLGDWEQTYESAYRVVSQESYNIEALRLLVLNQLTRESKASVTSSRVGDVIQVRYLF